jgi:hypothetical protein
MSMGGKPTLADEWVAAEEARNLRVAEERARKAEEALREARAWIKEPGQPGTIVETTEESAVLSAMMLNRFDAALAALVAERDTLREALRHIAAQPDSPGAAQYMRHAALAATETQP